MKQVVLRFALSLITFSITLNNAYANKLDTSHHTCPILGDEIGLEELQSLPYYDYLKLMVDITPYVDALYDDPATGLVRDYNCGFNEEEAYARGASQTCQEYDVTDNGCRIRLKVCQGPDGTITKTKTKLSGEGCGLPEGNTIEYFIESEGNNIKIGVDLGFGLRLNLVEIKPDPTQPDTWNVIPKEISIPGNLDDQVNQALQQFAPRQIRVERDANGNIIRFIIVKNDGTEVPFNMDEDGEPSQNEVLRRLEEALKEALRRIFNNDPWTSIIPIGGGCYGIFMSDPDSSGNANNSFAVVGC